MVCIPSKAHLYQKQRRGYFLPRLRRTGYGTRPEDQGRPELPPAGPEDWDLDGGGTLGVQYACLDEEECSQPLETTAFGHY